MSVKFFNFRSGHFCREVHRVQPALSICRSLDTTVTAKVAMRNTTKCRSALGHQPKAAVED